ncbi:MAG: 30S ribosomal protein S20 [Gemmatimonadota bacterium]|nr:30S ribosomal protein S20 [Gemmatimonadota bacterium]MEC9318182.1 30S ribosomal protein S20 [Gemmatimonadota bacterium]
MKGVFRLKEQMPNIKSAKKRMKLSAKARLRNRSERAKIRTAIKEVRATTSAKDSQEQLRGVVKLLDRAATKRLIHPNRVARVKSQLEKHTRSLTS